MNSRLIRFTSCTTLAIYLLVTTVSVFFHQHDHGDHGDALHASCHAGAAHRRHHAQGRHQHANSIISECSLDGHSHDGHSHDGGPSRVPLHDDDCNVCRLLAAKPLSVPQSILIVQIDVVSEIGIEAFIEPDHPFPSLPHSRGPPSFA